MGCSSSPTSGGTAPTLKTVTLTPVEVPVGVATTVVGTFEFVDPDGDVDSVEATLTFNGADTVSQTAAQGSAGVTAGNGQITLKLNIPSAGVVHVSIVLVDRASHRSTPAKGEITAK